MRSSVSVVVKMCVMTVVLVLLCSANAEEPRQVSEEQFVVESIGSVH